MSPIIGSRSISCVAILLFISICTCCTEQSIAANVSNKSKRELYPVEVDGKYGYMNKTGQIVIEPQFDGASDFSEGLARILVGDYETGRFGYIDTTGKIVIEPRFVGAGIFSEGLAAVDNGSRQGFIDKTGKYILSKTQDGKDLKDIVGYSEGLARITLDWKANHGPYDGFIDKAGKIVIPAKYHMAKNFSEGLAAVHENTDVPIHWGKDGYIDQKGQWVIKPQFYNANSFSEGFASVFVARDKCGYIDKKGQWIIEPQYQECGGFSEGLADVEINNQHGYIDRKGSVVIEAKYRRAWPFSGGLAQVETDGADGIPQFGYINNKGSYVWGPKPTSRFP